MTPVRDVAIVGAGLAGLACAVAAAAAGARVEVFDRAPALPDPPAHVDIVPNLLRDLGALGLADACVREGFVHQGVRLVDAGSGVQLDLDAPRLAGDRRPAAVGLRFGTLLRLLDDAARRSGARVQWQSRVGGVDAGSGQLHLADGSRRNADLIVVAAGGHGAPRHELLGAPGTPEARQHGWYALLPRPPEVDRSTWVVAPGGRKALLVPVSTGCAGVALLQPAAALKRLRPGDSRAGALRAVLQALPRPLGAIAGHLRDADPVAIRAVCPALLPRPWSRGAVLAVGDCAHSLPPQFGQAAAQSVEDAVVLGEELAAARPRSELLARFEARRFARAERVHAITTQAARWDLEPEADADLRRLHAALMQVVSTPA